MDSVMDRNGPGEPTDPGKPGGSGGRGGHPGAYRPHRVVVLALDGLLPFELGIPHRIFGRPSDAAGRPLYEVVTCSVRAPGPVRTDADFSIVVEHGPEALAGADTVVVPASYERGPLYEEGRLTGELAAALARIRPGTRLASICTGVYVLAAAGYLDGRPATTHWADAERFQRLFPRVDVDADVLFIDDGDVLTSAGVAAGIDLCLHMVRRDHGTAVANDVARRTVVPPHRDGGQAQYIHRPGAGAPGGGPTTPPPGGRGRRPQPLPGGDNAEQEAR
ncbi:GlxA family transcriptional regulator, partial [Streptomyces sp. NPDC059570]|uniref:GlxA family transcriptional regulator n=1 Tax=Streptomyces sp. NPDC059570 TaxID=3346870 RepID=UPI00368223FE